MSGMRAATAGAALKCAACQSVLCQRNAIGERIIRTRGIVAKQNGLILICPKCKASVPVAANFLVALDLAAFPPPCDATLRSIRHRP